MKVFLLWFKSKDTPNSREVGAEMYREMIEDKMAKEARARLNAGVK